MTSSGSTKKNKLIFCVGSNHRTASIATRENFYLSEVEIQKSIQHWMTSKKIQEIFILSTCNRCEIFGVTEHEDLNNSLSLQNLYLDTQKLIRGDQTPTQSQDAVYALTGFDAILHTQRVAASLDSLIPGETQITGQFKDAVTIARNEGGIGPLLGRLAQESLATAKQVRSGTEIGRHRVSISHAAVDLAKHASHHLNELRFLIVGAGEMSRVAAEYAASYKPKALHVVNRTKQKAYELVSHIGFGESYGLDQLYEQIARADVVICATNAPDYVIQKSALSQALKSKRERGPLFLIDISLPRTIDPSITTLDDIYLFDIDDLKQVVDRHLEKRKDALIAANQIVKDKVSDFERWLSQQDFAPALALSNQYFRDTMTREANKTFSRELFANLSEKQKEAIEQMLDATATKLTGDIAAGLKRSTLEDQTTVVTILNQLFKRNDG